MLPSRIMITHEKFTATYQHWCPQSQIYAGGDQLISALREGWTLADDFVAVKQYWKSGSRPVSIYYIVMTRDGETMVMPTLDNPFVQRYILEQSLTLVFDDDNERVEAYPKVAVKNYIK